MWEVEPKVASGRFFPRLQYMLLDLLVTCRTDEGTQT